MDVATLLNELPPPVPPDDRAVMARFSFGADHARRRAVVVDKLARIEPRAAARLARGTRLARVRGTARVANWRWRSPVPCWKFYGPAMS